MYKWFKLKNIFSQPVIYLHSSNDELADYIKHIPDYLVVVMVEKDVDKRNKVYKAVFHTHQLYP